MQEKPNGNQSLKDALLKCAVGFDASEVVEEYAVVDGEVKLIKRKVTKKDIPPDIKAVKLILDGEADVQSVSDEELLSQREKLISILKEEGIDYKI